MGQNNTGEAPVRGTRIASEACFYCHPGGTVQKFGLPSPVGIAMAIMHVTDSFHPPAAINLLLMVVNDRPRSFLLVPRAPES